MRPLPWRGEERTKRRGRHLARECEAYLSGDYAQYLDRRDRRIPNWSWISLLAHARPEQFRSLSMRTGGSTRLQKRAEAWWQAVAFLAAEVLSRADDDNEELEDLRRSILLPLELKDLSTGRPPQRPGELVRRVLEALDQHPRCQHI
jgi:hypothetical protein